MKCRCGCGEDTKINTKTGMPNRFVYHHNLRHKTDDHIKKTSESLTGRKLSDAHKEKLSIAGSNRTLSEEHKRKIGDANRLRIWTEKSKKKASESRIERKLSIGVNNPFYGKKHSQKTKDKISSHQRTDEHLKKISEALTGKKHSQEHKDKISMALKGAMNHAWIDGRSFIPYCSRFNGAFKEQIRERDNRTCQLCGKLEIDNGTKLPVHHIHYDKENCYPDCVALCISCNSVVNANRHLWEEYFMGLLECRGIIETAYDLESVWGFEGGDFDA